MPTAEEEREADVKDRAAKAFAKAFETAVYAALPEIQPGADLGELVPASWASLLGIAIRGCLDCGMPPSQIGLAAEQMAAAAGDTVGG